MAIFLHVFMDMNTHTYTYPPHTPFPGSHKRPQKPKEAKLLFERTPEFVGLPGTAAAPLSLSRLQRGSRRLQGCFGAGRGGERCCV